MAASIREESLRTAVRLSSLDMLDLPLLLLNAENEPHFLSSRAATILRIRNRGNLASAREVLEPLIEFARTQNRGARPDRLARVTTQVPKTGAELQLTTEDGRSVSVLAYVRPFTVFAVSAFAVSADDSSAESESADASSEDQPGTVVVFHDLTPLDPLLRIVDHTRKTRAMVVESLLSSTDMPAGSPTISAATGTPASSTATTELLSGLTHAIDIVDPLVVSSAKILLDTTTPALLAVQQASFHRIVAHLILEAVDFGGPYGRTRVRAALSFEEGPDGRPLQAATSVQVLVIAERQLTIPVDTSPLEVYFLRRALPTDYRVATSDRPSKQQAEPEIERPETDRGESTFEQLRIKDIPNRRTAKPLVAEASMSENLRIAVREAREAQAEVRAALASSSLLILSAEFPMMLAAHPKLSQRKPD